MNSSVSQPFDLPFDTNYRSITDIIWSCVATIFACTWISVHPNVSGFNTNWTRRLKDRAFLMFWGIAAPEFLVIFAYRQWIGSRDINEVVLKAAALEVPNARAHWTHAHSHFLQMGGFMFHDPSSNTAAEYIEAHELISDNAGDIGRDALHMVIKHSPTEDEIWDRSKADTFSKFIVAFQTSWFLAQIITRRIQNLAITEIEVITLAYAAFNGAMYAFWWEKPLDVQSPIVIPFNNVYGLRQQYDLRQHYAALLGRDEPRRPRGPSPQVETWSNMIFRTGDTFSLSSEPVTLTSILPVHQSSKIRMNSWTNIDASCSNRIKIITRRSSLDNHSSIKLRIKIILQKTMYYLRKPLDIMHYVYLVTGFRRQNGRYPIWVFNEAHQKARSHFSSTSVDKAQNAGHLDAVPMFYTYAKAKPYAPESVLISALAMFLASCYGALHCLAWSFTRATSAEALLWRISSLIICIAPVVSCVTFLVAARFSSLFYMPSQLDWLIRGALVTVLAPFHNYIFVPILLPCYIAARFILIGLAFAQLRSLPRSAYESVDWSNFLPHV